MILNPVIMPIYEYDCRCGRHYEEIVKFGENPGPLYCIGCDNLVRRTISVPSVRTSRKSPRPELGPAPPGEGYSELMCGE